MYAAVIRTGMMRTQRRAVALRALGARLKNAGGTSMTIQNPSTWGWARLRHVTYEIGSARPEEYWGDARRYNAAPAVRRIGLSDLWDALKRGVDDFAANRTDVIFLCIIYPA